MIGDRHRTALVTGAADGLGRAFAEMLAAEGLKVWATSRHRGRLDAVVERSAGAITGLELELSDTAALETSYRRGVAEAGGRFDVVVNNAGFGVFGPFESQPAGTWEDQLRTMLLGSLRLAHLAWSDWRRMGGAAALVNVSSLAADFPIPFLSGYNVAKAGLSALSESLVTEARGTPVQVVDFRPGDYRTGFNRAMAARGSGSVAAAESVPGRVWRRLESLLSSAPAPARAARDLRRVLRSGRSGTVRSGSLFQARVAPLASRFLPVSAQRALAARYFEL